MERRAPPWLGNRFDTQDPRQILRRGWLKKSGRILQNCIKKENNNLLRIKLIRKLEIFFSYNELKFLK